MSHYKPYVEYKNSGVEWLGDVPKNWEVFPLFAVASESNASNKGMLEDNLLSLSYGSIVRKDINTNDGLLPESFETYQIVEPGDIIFRLTDLQNDKRSLRTAIVNETGIITSAYIAVSPKSVEPKYFNYLLRAYDVQKVFYSMGGGMRQSMKYDDLRRMAVLKPSKNEQLAICEMLDRETTRIDGLVSKKTRFIELLREKRQALITHAVTKGLDPNVMMKDTGVEWLGDVPEHWGVKRIKYLAMHTGSGKTPSGGAEVYQDSGVLFLRSQNVHDDGLRLNDVVYISEEIDQEMRGSRVSKGDVLLNITGGSIGRSCLVNMDIGPANVNQHVCIVRTTKLEIARWISECFLSSVIKAQIDFFQNGAGREGLNFEQIGNMVIALPPMAELITICSTLVKSRVRLDNLISKTERSIELLKERRSALITAAVTGQIDLREAA